MSIYDKTFLTQRCLRIMSVVLITGANRGIGFEAAKQLAESGHDVIIGSRNKKRGDDAVLELADQGLTVSSVKLDVTIPEDIEAAVEFVNSKFGKLDALVNNAGIMHKEEQWIGNSTLDISEKALTQTFFVNFFGPFRVSRAFVPLLEKGDNARIVNLSAKLASLQLHADRRSEVGNTKPFAYNASKTALNQLTTHLAHALRRKKIKVVSIYPGWVKTQMGGDNAKYELKDGVKTFLHAVTGDIETATFFHDDHEVPW